MEGNREQDAQSWVSKGIEKASSDGKDADGLLQCSYGVIGSMAHPEMASVLTHMRIGPRNSSLPSLI